MINTKLFLEKFLQKQRFKRIDKQYLSGSVLDFGGNEGELGAYVDGEYTVVNYDHSPLAGKTFHNIIALAVIEHIRFEEVFSIFKKFREHLHPSGYVVLTTPTPASKPVLELLAFLHLLDRENIQEHQHYWSKQDLYQLATASDMEVVEYKTFQFGFNQLCILRKKVDLPKH
jgi:2-polyprenyl-3-methyl-5-hydroxy-6-metoxy-1,4-benzoquinol methylase